MEILMLILRAGICAWAIVTIFNCSLAIIKRTKEHKENIKRIHDKYGLSYIDKMKKELKLK